MLQPGQKLRMIKFVAYGWSGERSLPAVRDQVWAALTAARQTGWDGMLAEQRAFLDDFWDRADVEVDGDPEVQQAVRFALFHVLQAGARAENRPIPAKGLTGPGYGGHAFWDTETFVLPMLTFTAPSAAASALRWRHATLPLAIDRAAQLGLAGAAFPWRTIDGQECSGYWPAGTAAFHVNADIADAAVRYVDATGDEEFARGPGVDLLVHTARLWRSLGHYDAEGRFHIDGVTGPDEYSALADDNVYTNLMARRNLRAAADAAKQYPERARELGVSDAESAGWRDAARGDGHPLRRDARRARPGGGVHPAPGLGFRRHPGRAVPAHAAFPLLRPVPQAGRQAGRPGAGHAPVAATRSPPSRRPRNFDYYERLTVRDSSLSACTQAVIAAEVGHLDLAFDYLGEAALMDLRDLEHNTRDGVHIASLAGTWVALVSGFGGLRSLTRRDLQLRPAAPRGPDQARVHPFIRGRRLRVEVTHAEATYALADGDPLEIVHHGQPVTLSAASRKPGPSRRHIPAAAQPAARTRAGPPPRRPEHDLAESARSGMLASVPRRLCLEWLLCAVVAPGQARTHYQARVTYVLRGLILQRFCRPTVPDNRLGRTATSRQGQRQRKSNSWSRGCGRAATYRR